MCGPTSTLDNPNAPTLPVAHSIIAVATIALASSRLIGQDTTRARPDTTKPAVDTQPRRRRRPPAPALPFDFSGILLRELPVRRHQGQSDRQSLRGRTRVPDVPGDALASTSRFASRPTSISSAIRREISTIAAGPFAPSTRTGSTTSSAALATSSRPTLGSACCRRS